MTKIRPKGRYGNILGTLDNTASCNGIRYKEILSTAVDEGRIISNSNIPNDAREKFHQSFFSSTEKLILFLKNKKIKAEAKFIQTLTAAPWEEYFVFI